MVTDYEKEKAVETDTHNLFRTLKRHREGTPNYEKVVAEILKRQQDLREYQQRRKKK